MNQAYQKIHNGYWLGKKEKQILKDSWEWPGVSPINGIDITVPVGPPYHGPSEMVDQFQGSYYQRNRLRIDAVVHSGNTRMLTEVTPTAGSGTTGKILLYRDWYVKDKDVSEDQVEPCIVDREHHVSTEAFCQKEGISLADVQEGGPLEWVIRSA